MEDNRSPLLYCTAALAFAAMLAMLAAPYVTNASPAFKGTPTYITIAGALIETLARSKDVGLSLTLIAMLFSFGGMLLTVIFAFLPKALGRALLVLSALAAALGLVPVFRVLFGGLSWLNVVGIPGDALSARVLGAGFYLVSLFFLATGFLSVWQLLPSEFPQKEIEPSEEQPTPASEEKRTPRPSGKAAPSAAPLPPHGWIEGKAGMYSGMRFRVDEGETVLFGRSTHTSNVVITMGNDFVSRRHCAVRLEPSGEYTVVDYSKNGTYTGPRGADPGIRIPRGVATALKKGSVIRLGRHPNDFLLK